MEPWALEIYWQHKGRMGVVWPYEVDWYSCDWPAHPQLFVLGDSPTDQAPALIPTELSAALMEDMDPPLHANLSPSGRSFSTTQSGTCLLKYTTHDNIWFEVVQTVSHTNWVYFDLQPKDWPIGQELVPGEPEAHALWFDADGDYVMVGQSFLNRLSDWTLSFWFNPSVITNGTLYSEGDPLATLKVELTPNAQLQVGVWNKTVPGYWVWTTTSGAPVQSNRWQQLTVALAGASDTNGTLRLYLDDYTWEATNFHRLNFDGVHQAVLAATSWNPVTDFFHGKLDEMRIWNMALTADQIRSNRYDVWPDTAGNLIANFPCDEGRGAVAHNLAGDKDGTVYGDRLWSWGQVIPSGDWAEFPGYIHVAEGDRYNVNRYDYPTEAAPDAASYVFAANTGQLEVWWANQSRQVDMPAVYYPSRVTRYQNVWPDDPPQLVIASGLGSSGDQLTPADNALYFDGSNDTVNVGHDAGFNVGNTLTIEAWIKPASLSGRHAVFSTRLDNAAGSFQLEVGAGSDGANRLVVSGVNTWVAQTDDNALAPNQWTHVAYTRTGTGAGTHALYVNGVPQTLVSDANYPFVDNASDKVIGSGTSGDFFQGEVGEVRIWNVARTQAELQANGLTRLRGDEPGLVAYYPFGKSDDPAVLADVGPNSLNGAIAGAIWAGAGRPLVTSAPFVTGAPSIYSQNDPSRPGYNPNEEHALIMGGVAFALRNDLNQTNSSQPFVLVDGLDPDRARPQMAVFSVAATNLEYRFERDLTAGLPILPILPLGAMPLCTGNYTDTEPPAWQDRKLGWWAVSAGDDGGAADAIMHFYYQMQPTFYFPALAPNQQPAIGAEVPWLPMPFHNSGTSGTPVAVTYHVSWPDNLPELQLGQTLTVATRGLPDVWDQLSAQVVYDQSARLGQGSSATLFDPVADAEVDLDRAVIDAMVQSQLARQELTSPLIRFPKLPPSIYPRLFFDPNRGAGGRLVLEGQLVSTLTGSGYLLLNLLEDFEKGQAKATASGIDSALKTKWDTAVTSLPGKLT